MAVAKQADVYVSVAIFETLKQLNVKNIMLYKVFDTSIPDGLNSIVDLDYNSIEAEKLLPLTVKKKKNNTLPTTKEKISIFVVYTD